MEMEVFTRHRSKPVASPQALWPEHTVSKPIQYSCVALVVCVVEVTGSGLAPEGV